MREAGKLKSILETRQLIKSLRQQTILNEGSKLFDCLGGIKDILLKYMFSFNMHSNSNNNVLNLKSIINELNRLKKYQDNIDYNNNNNNINELNNINNNNDNVSLQLLPKDMIYSITKYLRIKDIGKLTLTCLNMSIICLPELNKVDINVFFAEKWILNDNIILKKCDLDNLCDVIRVDGNMTWKYFKALYSKSERDIWTKWNENDLVMVPVPRSVAKHDQTTKLRSIAQNERYFCCLSRQNIVTLTNNNNGSTNSGKKVKNKRFPLKYFDISSQKLFTIEWIEVDISSAIINHKELIIKYIIRTLFNKHKHVFKYFKKYYNACIKNNDNDDKNSNNNDKHFYNLFRFYKQKFLQISLNTFDDVFIGTNNLGIHFSGRHTIIFQLNIKHNIFENILFKNDIHIWKQRAMNNNEPFCENVIKYLKYNDTKRKAFEAANMK